MAQYAVMIFERVAPEDLRREVMQAHMRPARPDRRAGRADRRRAGAASRPETATSIRGEQVTDGPFIETKEVLGGVYVLEARDLDHALALARLTPIVDGGVEVRPLDRLPGRGGELTRRRAGGRRRAPARVGRTCSPRRCASRATSTPPRRRCRTRTSRRWTTWARDGVPAQPGRVADDRRPPPRAEPVAPRATLQRQAPAAARPEATTRATTT